MPKPLFCSIISFAYTRPLKLDPQKKGVQKLRLRPSSIKKTPPLDRLLTLPFGGINNHWKNSVFRFSGFCFLANFSFLGFWFCSPPKNYPQMFPALPGWPKNRGKQGFFCLFRGNVFWWWCFSVWCPYARVSLHAPSSLQMCDLSLMSYFFLLFSFCFPLFFLGGGGCIRLYTLITSMVLHQWPNTWSNHRKPQYLKFLFLMFCFGACSLTLSAGPHNNRNPKPFTPENRICWLHNALNPVLKCLLLQCLSNIKNKFAPKIGP